MDFEKKNNSERILTNLFSSSVICEAIVTALSTGLIPLLQENLTLSEIHNRLGLRNASIKAALDLFMALRWLEKRGDLYVSVLDSPLAILMPSSDRGEHWRYRFQNVLGDLQKSQSLVFRSGDAGRFPVRPDKPPKDSPFFKDQGQMVSFSQFASLAAKTAGEELAKLMTFSEAKTIVDLGGNDGSFLIPILETHKHLSGIIVDLPRMSTLATTRIGQANLNDRCQFRGLDFFYGPLPDADLYVSGFVLHDWPDTYSEILIEKIGSSVRSGGHLILHENLLDNPNPNKRLQFTTSHFQMVLLGETGFGAAGEKTSSEYVQWFKPFGFSLENILWGECKSFLVFRKA
jgi:SAM-dependent methyltransferase